MVKGDSGGEEERRRRKARRGGNYIEIRKGKEN